MDILTVHEIRAKLKGKHAQLNGFSMELQRGKTYGLIGAERSGKSSVLRAILGLLKLQGGVIRWHIDRNDVGASVGDPAFHRELSIRGNLEAQANLLQKKPTKDRIAQLMEKLKIDEYRAGGRSMRNLLTYQKASTAIALAMLGSPELLILDEPMIAINLECREAFCDLFKEEYTNDSYKTALITAQNKDELEGIATDFIYIDGGRNV